MFELVTFKDPFFDAKFIEKTFKEIISNPIYKQNMMRLKAISMTTGGRDLACDTIEKTYIHKGPAATINHATVKKLWKLNKCHACLCDCF